MNQPSDAPVFDARGVTKIYDMGEVQVHALRGVDLTLRESEFVVLLGPSGSGKSTLLNILGLLDRPTGGSYRLRGQEVLDLDDDELSELRSTHFGFIFQSYNLLPQLNVLENIQVPLSYQDDPPEDGEERARALAKRVGLEQRLDHRPTELSGGQQQRIAIARALINDPAMILADEATGNLDSKTADEILGLLDELHAEGKTILLVTHEPSVGERAENVLRLSDGKIESVRRGRGGA